MMYEYAIVGGPGLLLEHGTMPFDKIELCVCSISGNEVLLLQQIDDDATDEWFH